MVEVHESPIDCEKMYSFSNFAIKLNNLHETHTKCLPPTDCRFRTDLRAYENADLKLASFEKNRLEES